MTGEPTHTTSKERMAPELIFSSEHTPQLSITCFESAVAIMLHFQICLAHYTALQMKNSVRIISVINPVTMENTSRSTDDSHFYKRTVPCIALPRISTLGCQQRGTEEDKGKSMVRELYVLRFAKRHVSG